MANLVDEIKLDDFDVDEDEYEDTIEDITGAVGGTPAETDFGGRQIQTPACRGSVEWEKERHANISIESQNSIQDLNDRLDLLKLRDDSPSLRRTIQTLERQKAELARDEFRDYVSEEYGYTQQGTAFVREADFSVDDSGRVKVKYKGKTAWLTKQNRMEFYPLDSIASQIKGTDPKASEFIRVEPGIRDYKRGSTGKVQRSAKRV